MSTEKTTYKATKNKGLTPVEREIMIRDLQMLARKVLALNSGKDIRFVREGDKKTAEAANMKEQL